MVSSKYGWSKIVLTVLLVVGQCAVAEHVTLSGQVTLAASANPRAKKVSEIIKDNDLRYYATLGAGCALTLAGFISLIKNRYYSNTIENSKESSTDEWEQSRSYSAVTGVNEFAGLGSILWGLFIIANAKNIPALYDILGEKAGMALQCYLEQQTR